MSIAPIEQNNTELQDILEAVNSLPNANSEGGGFTPTIDVTPIEGGHQITVSDVDGDEIFNVMDGIDGKSAYQIAHELDSTIGTEADWIASLNGADGQDGDDGKSAYEIALEFDPTIGTKEDWIESLSVTIISTTESENDGGSNIVTFSDGSTITIKNGSTGAPFTYDQFKPEELEALKPVKGTDYFDGEDYILTEADKTEIANETKGLLDDTVQEMREIASGKCNADAFDTVEAMTAWLQTDNNAENLKLGDVFYIRDVGVPDYWWEPIVDNIELTKYTEKDVIISGVGAARILETTKVVLDDYALKTDLPALSFVVSDTGPATGTANTVMTIVI
jgi:hypothetical protein